MSNLPPSPQPFKARNREKIVRYASLYCLHMADLYIQQCITGQSNNLKEFLKWLDKRFWEAQAEITKRGNWDVKFKEGDTYKMNKKTAQIRQMEAEVGLEGIAKFIYSMVRLYWDKTGKSNDLKKFATKFIPAITKQIANGKY